MSAATKKGVELRLEIFRRGLTVSIVAARVGVSRGHLGRLLSGRVEMSEKLARDLSFALKIPKDQIWALWRGEQ